MSLVNLHPALARLDELAADPPTGKPSLIGYTREELTEFIKNAGEKSFRADQLYNALFARGLTSLQDVTTLSKSLRAELESHFTVDRPTIDQVEASTDGTAKVSIRRRGWTGIRSSLHPRGRNWESNQHPLCLKPDRMCCRL